MRYRGGGVGHKSTRQASDTFLADRHPDDLERNEAQSETQWRQQGEHSKSDKEDLDEPAMSQGSAPEEGESDEEVDENNVDDAVFDEDTDYEYGAGPLIAESDDSESDSDQSNDAIDSADDALGAEDGCGLNNEEDFGFADL